MKTLGIVGGIAPPSTIEYYRSIVDIHRDRANRPPRVLINSVDGDVVLGHLAAGRHTELVAALLEALQQLASAGAELALLASISVHVAFDGVRAATPLPLIDIVEATAGAVADFKRLGLFATRFTMQADLFGPALASRGIIMVAPSADEQRRSTGSTSMSSSPGGSCPRPAIGSSPSAPVCAPTRTLTASSLPVRSCRSSCLWRVTTGSCTSTSLASTPTPP